MRILRLRIENYKGVESREIDFARDGVTIVQGPNEIGKTSLAEAIGVIFSLKASAGGAPARALRPVHRDADPHILLEAESGDYHFIYEKTFKPRAGATSLRILEPASERNNYTADDAHDRAERILRDTLDKDLWDALIIRQGDGIDIPNMKGQTALMDALDAAAGGAVMDRRTESLFERVQERYFEYHTRNGRQSDARTKAGKQATEAGELVESLKRRLLEVENKSRRADDLRERIDKNRLLLSQAVRERDEAANRTDAIRQADTALANAVAERERAANAHDRAQRDVMERERLHSDLAIITRTSADERRAVETMTAAGDDEEPLDAIQAFLTSASLAAQLAGDALARAQADERHLDNAGHREILKSTLQAYQEAERDFLAAKEELRDNPVTEAVLGEVVAAERVLETARLRLEADTPRVTLRGLAETTIGLNGQDVRIGASEERTESVDETLEITVPGHITVRVEARLDTELRDRYDDAVDRLRTVLERVGVPSPAVAEARAAARRRATDVRERALREMSRCLGEDTFDHLQARLRELDVAISRHLAGCDAESLPADREAAALARRQAEGAKRDADSALRDAQTRYEAGREMRSELAFQKRSAIERANRAEAERSRQAERLAELEAAISLASLQATAAEAAESLHKAELIKTDAANALAALDPERTADKLLALDGTVETFRKKIDEDSEELWRLTGELEARGDTGLFDELGAAERELGLAEERRDRLERAAAAAKMLYDTMSRHRTEARREYTEPLRRKIEDLGKWIWNESFSVDLDSESLSIQTRTLDGVTVPFVNLSGGTREQLSLIFRAACAMIVSESEGMPLILDDTLGYTDPERLKLVGQILSRAARECQILVFTCVPDRYAFVGRAKIIDLS